MNNRSSSVFFNNVLINLGSVKGASFLILLIGLLAFEIFNFASTRQAVEDMIGVIKFGFLDFALILAVAFCAIDIAGVARLFTPQVGNEEPAEIWYLFGAWILASAFNAMFTWFCINAAISRNENLVTTQAMSRETLQNIFPIVVAVFIWVIRMLLIGTLSSLGDRLLHGEGTKTYANRQRTDYNKPTAQTYPNNLNTGNRNTQTPGISSRPVLQSQSSHQSQHTRPERPIQTPPRPNIAEQPSYHNLLSSGRETGDPRKT